MPSSPTLDEGGRVQFDAISRGLEAHLKDLQATNLFVSRCGRSCVGRFRRRRGEQKLLLGRNSGVLITGMVAGHSCGGYEKAPLAVAREDDDKECPWIVARLSGFSSERPA